MADAYHELITQRSDGKVVRTGQFIKPLGGQTVKTMCNSQEDADPETGFCPWEYYGTRGMGRKKHAEHAKSHGYSCGPVFYDDPEDW